MLTVDTDVLVVGAGVTGLTASVALATHGVGTVTIARHPGTAPQPRAHITNQRTMEVLRDLGLEDRAAAIGTSLRELNHNVTVTSLAGTELTRYESYGTGERLSDYLGASPCTPLNAPQHLLEPVLLDAARERGADVRFAHELVSLEQSDEAVRAHVRDHGAGTEYVVRARYLVGADGGRSRVADELGIGFEGQAGLRHMQNMWIEADLSRYTAHRPGVIYVVAKPGDGFWVGSGSFICVRPWDEWVLVREYDPAAGEPDSCHEAVAAFARTLIGDPDIDVRLKDVSTWQVNNLVAERYRSGRVFLAGDAAHRHPPAGGLGSNTSVQDAFNLAWKLAFVVSGAAGEELLDSYDEERRPVGRQVVDRAIRNMENMLPIIEALGFRRGQSAEEGETALDELFSDVPGAEQRRAELTAAVQLQDYRSNAHGVELGQRYTSCAVLDDGSPLPEPGRDPELYYRPTTHPGARLPHAWVEHRGRGVSTLDVLGHGRLGLVVGIGGGAWAEAAEKVGSDLGIEVPVHVIGYRCHYDDVLGDWSRVREVGDGGALLVRPDLHIAWRSSGPVSSPVAALNTALRTVLRRAPVADSAVAGAHAASCRRDRAGREGAATGTR